MQIIEKVKAEVIKASDDYKRNATDNFDFWEEHIKLVVKEALMLAEKYGADKEIVELGALLHDIALVSNIGTRQEHHINGKHIANDILTDFSYSEDKKERVLGCILHHRSSKNVENTEELCVADADILAHFDTIPMVFHSAFKRQNIELNEVRSWLCNEFEKDFNDLSERTKSEFRPKYENICRIVLGDIAQ